MSDADRGLGEISQVFCANGLVGLVIGSCASCPVPLGFLVVYWPGKLALAPGDNQIDRTQCYPLERVWTHVYKRVVRINIR